MEENRKTSDTERLILEAAEREFAAKGFGGARTTSIAEQAGVTHAMLHYYFRTKEKLYETVILQKFSDISNLIEKALGDDSLPLFERLEKGISTHFDFLSANPDLPRYVLSVLAERPDFMTSLKEELQGKIGNVVKGLQAQIDATHARGECRQVDAKMLLLDIVSLNIFPFVASPMLNMVFGDAVGNRETFLERRKQENITTILNKLKP